MQAIKIKNLDLYFGSPMMVKKQGILVPNYTSNYYEAGLINENDFEPVAATLPIKRENLELFEK